MISAIQKFINSLAKFLTLFLTQSPSTTMTSNQVQQTELYDPTYKGDEMIENLSIPLKQKEFKQKQRKYQIYHGLDFATIATVISDSALIHNNNNNNKNNKKCQCPEHTGYTDDDDDYEEDDEQEEEEDDDDDAEEEKSQQEKAREEHENDIQFEKDCYTNSLKQFKKIKRKLCTTSSRNNKLCISTKVAHNLIFDTIHKIKQKKSAFKDLKHWRGDEDQLQIINHAKTLYDYGWSPKILVYTAYMPPSTLFETGICSRNDLTKWNKKSIRLFQKKIYAKRRKLQSNIDHKKQFKTSIKNAMIKCGALTEAARNLPLPFGISHTCDVLFGCQKDIMMRLRDMIAAEAQQEGWTFTRLYTTIAFDWS